jgi:hypothetical protein
MDSCVERSLDRMLMHGQIRYEELGPPNRKQREEVESFNYMERIRARIRVLETHIDHMKRDWAAAASSSPTVPVAQAVVNVQPAPPAAAVTVNQGDRAA